MHNFNVAVKYLGMCRPFAHLCHRFSVGYRLNVSKVVKSSPGKLLQHKLANDSVGAVVELNKITPFQGGVLQEQYATVIAEDEAVVCSFIPRGRINEDCAVETESYNVREIDSARLSLLSKYLLEYGETCSDEILAPGMEGTPPYRIFNSYVAPRKLAQAKSMTEGHERHQMNKVTNSIELSTLERSAKQTAAHISLKMRHLRADRSQYLRNFDMPTQQPLPQDEPPGGNEGVPSVPGLLGKSIVFVLDNIRSAYNVGSMYRTAETAGCVSLFTCGITPTPLNPKVAKTALSATKSVPTMHFDSTLEAVQQLEQDGYTIVALETTSKSVLYTNVCYTALHKVAFIVGNETSGVSSVVLDAVLPSNESKVPSSTDGAADLIGSTDIVEKDQIQKLLVDYIVEVPTYGPKNSLNVAIALPIVVFEVLRQWAPPVTTRPCHLVVEHTATATLI